MRAWSRWSLASPVGGRGVHGSADPPRLKDELRRLFKLVHPDLFHNCPEQQATNQRSFQLLQEYLSALKGQQQPQPPAYQLEFYVRNAEDNSSSVKKVEVWLPPPHVRRPGGELLPATRSAVARLLSAFGLSPHFSGTLVGDEGREQQPRRQGLVDFLQLASEVQRQNETAVDGGLERRMIVVRNALRVGRGVTACFRGDGWTVASQVEALESLAVALDGAPGVRLGGCCFVLGDCCGVDAMGKLWLDRRQGPADWSDFIAQLDVASVVAKAAADRRRRLDEFKLARLMEVSMVFADDALASEDDYRQFLQRMGAQAEELGAVAGGRHHGVAVRVVRCDEKLGVDPCFGYIRVPVSGDAALLYQLVEEGALEARRVRDELKRREERMVELERLVRRQLRLRRLAFDTESLSKEQVESACSRLLTLAGRLAAYTEGLSLCISDKQQLPTAGIRGAMAYLSWDFVPDDG